MVTDYLWERKKKILSANNQSWYVSFYQLRCIQDGIRHIIFREDTCEGMWGRHEGSVGEPTDHYAKLTPVKKKGKEILGINAVLREFLQG